MTDNMTHLDFRNTSAVTRFSEIVCNKNETAVMMTFARLSCWHVQQQQSTVNCEHYLIDVSRCPSGNDLFFLFAKRYISFFLCMYMCESGCVCVWYPLWDINYSCLAKQTTRTRLSNAI